MRLFEFMRLVPTTEGVIAMPPNKPPSGQGGRPERSSVDESRRRMMKKWKERKKTYGKTPKKK